MNPGNSRPGHIPHVMERAVPGDGPELLQLIEADASKGGLAIVYTRRPNPVDSFALESAATSLGVMRDESQAICLMEACIPRRVYVAGCDQKLVYVSSVRKREGSLYGINFFKKAYDYEMAVKGGGFAGFCSVLNDNRAAIDLFLKKKRRSLPPIAKLCDYTTFLVNPAVLKKQKPAGSGVTAGSGDASADEAAPYYASVVPRAEDLPEIMAFLRDEGRRYDLFPVVDDLKAQFSGLELGDCVMIKDREGAILAFGALWDQRHYRQYVIKRYSGPFRPLSHLSWLIQRFGYIPLPPAGTTVPVLMLTLLLAKHGDPVYYSALTRELAKSASQKKCPVLVVGLSQNNANYPFWQQLKSIHFESTIFTYETRQNTLPLPDGKREIYLECGLL